jgi:hypothetical protein
MKRTTLWLAVVGLTLAPEGAARPKQNGGAPMVVTSATFHHLGEIPTRHTCEGKDVSPPLAWTGVPSDAKSLVLIVDDPDAPDPLAPRTVWVHWVLFNLPPTAAGLPEGVRRDYLPPGTREGLNDWGRPGYGGPCPPIGRHRYFHKVYALDAVLSGFGGPPTKAQIERAMEGRVLARGEIIGTYEKKRK